jgi:hypothetical protein
MNFLIRNSLPRGRGICNSSLLDGSMNPPRRHAPPSGAIAEIRVMSSIGDPLPVFPFSPFAS